MRRIGNRITTPLFSLLFAASLAFGVTSVFAQADQGEGRCPDDGWSYLAGYCSSPEYCNLKCLGRYYSSGECIAGPEGNCCVCQL